MGVGDIVFRMGGLLHFEAGAVPGQFHDRSFRYELNLGHDGAVVHVQDDDTAGRSAQIDLTCTAKKTFFFFIY